VPAVFAAVMGSITHTGQTENRIIDYSGETFQWHVSAVERIFSRLEHLAFSAGLP